MRNIILITLISLCISSNAQRTYCDNINTTFQAGEKLVYMIQYNWIIPITKVGIAHMQLENTTLNNQKVLHLDAHGTTTENWEYFFKVDDRYQSWMHPFNMQPDSFKRDVNEDGFIIDNAYHFDKEKKRIYTKNSSKKKPYKYDTLKTTTCTFDVISALYYARSLDDNTLFSGEAIPITVALDGELFTITFKYIEKDRIKLGKLGKFNTRVFEARLIDGSVFKDGDVMTVHVSDDKNKIPLMIETPIIIGKVKAYIISQSGLKHPLTSKID